MQTEASKKEHLFAKGKIQEVEVYPLKKFVDERGWLAELFRHDELDEEFYPTMAYISFTEPDTQRGPHEHVDQADLFCFIGPSNFKLRLWDNREKSEKCKNSQFRTRANSNRRFTSGSLLSKNLKPF